ncbi:MAG: penicillin-binding protein 1B, partial [Paraglaciecola sp.]
MTKASSVKPKPAKPKPTKSQPASNLSIWQKLNPFSWLFRHWGKLLFVSVLVIVAYALYLDARISHKFAGNKWQVPAQIYARPMFLSLKQEISIKEIEEELQLLG